MRKSLLLILVHNTVVAFENAPLYLFIMCIGIGFDFFIMEVLKRSILFSNNFLRFFQEIIACALLVPSVTVYKIGSYSYRAWAAAQFTIVQNGILQPRGQKLRQRIFCQNAYFRFYNPFVQIINPTGV